MAFGFSFGKNKETTNNKAVVDKTELTNQTQNSDRNSTTNSSGTVNTSGVTNTSGTQVEQSRTANQSTGLTAAEQTGSQQLFGDQVLGQLEAVVSGLLGSTGGGGPVGNFDPESFVADGLASAGASQQLALDDSINKLFSNVGGTAGGNSAVALLANQLQGQASANLAGVRSQLTGQANEINRGNIETGLAVSGQEQNFLGNLLAQLRGGRTSTTGAETTTQAQTQAGTASGSTQNDQQQSQQSTQQTQQTQQLIELLSQVLSGTTNTTGTETTTGTNTKKGGGFGLSI